MKYPYRDSYGRMLMCPHCGDGHAIGCCPTTVGQHLERQRRERLADSFRVSVEFMAHVRGDGYPPFDAARFNRRMNGF